MSLTKSQLDALVDRNCKSNLVSYPRADLTADENLAIDRFLSIAIPASGKWQLDDSNHTDYPIIKTNLVSGQRDYSFTEDENGNLILDIFRVTRANPSGIFEDIKRVDMQSDQDVTGFYDGQNLTGTPNKYDLTANGVFLDAIPNYNVTGGLQLHINREASYFTTSDTTKKVGFDGRFHEYFALYPSILYCKRNKMFDLADRYQIDLDKMEALIKYTYAGRERGQRRSLKANVENCR